MPDGDWIDELPHDVVILACAISAGFHGALVPGHFAEGTAGAIGFLSATVILAALAVSLTVRPTSVLPLAGAAAVFAGLLVAYALAATTGLLAASSLIWRPPVAMTLPQPKGTT